MNYIYGEDNTEMFRKCCGFDKKAHIITYGCQQNESDSERIASKLLSMEYKLVDNKEDADLIIFNTCSIREGAEQKLYGNLGAIKNLKNKNPDLIVGVGGCMAAQKDVVEYIKNKFKFVNFFFTGNNICRLDSLIPKVYEDTARFSEVDLTNNPFAEALSFDRKSKFKAYVPIMNGCNNFCSYCIVPYVRGREVSRESVDVYSEVKRLSEEGYKEITLLGQNVNSYAKNLPHSLDFANLLRFLNEIEGDFKIRFMTSHPKDLSFDLIDAIAESDKVYNHIHLPVQSGSDKILKEMNRKYTVSDYMKIIDYAREKIPDVTFSSDIIVGFPGETEEDFQDTLNLVEKIEYSTLFTFLYSKRPGTPAAVMENQIPDDVKHERFDRLVALQNKISRKINGEFVGKTIRILAEGVSQSDPNNLTGRTSSNIPVNFFGISDMIGKYLDIEITEAKTWSLFGKIKEI